MHVYLTKAIKRDGELVPTENLGYRGKSGKNDDPKAFKRLMEARGLRVHLSEEYIGRLVDKNLKILEH